MKTHVIFGAGLIGCFLGGIFTWKNLSVKLVCRNKIKEKLINGLTLTDYEGNEARIETLDFLDSDELTANGQSDFHCAFLWLTVKCTGVEQAAKDIRPLVGDDTVIFCCQNGLGSEQIIKGHFPNNLVLRVMVPFNVAEPEVGHLHRGSQGTLTLEAATQRQEVVTLLSEILDCELMPVAVTNDMQGLLWAKLQLNLGNSINALANIPVKIMLEQKPYRLVIAAMMEELLAVTDKLGIALPKVTSLKAQQIPFILKLPNFLFKVVANKMLAIDPTVRTSMWWDLSQGKKTEISHLNGAIVTAAEKLGLDCPVNKAIIYLIEQSEKLTEQNVSLEGWTANDLLKEITSKSKIAQH
jgi:2-dehydropantoate 2-reductase